MKALRYVWLAASLILSSCSQKSETPVVSTNSPAASTSPLDAPGGYLTAVTKGQQSAIKTIDTTSLDKAIQLFAVENGRNPKDLNELVQQKFIPTIPETPFGTKLVYDPGSGTVKVVNQQSR